jgi:uncharacterized protein
VTGRESLKMPAKPAVPLRFDASIVSELACPACRGGLDLDGLRLVCVACRRAYPVIDEIPVLIAERADAPREPDASHLP